MLVFFYTLENHTDRDYRLNNAASLTLAARLKRQGSLSPDHGDFLTAKFPLFIPAREKVRYALHLAYPYTGPSLPSAEAEHRQARADILASYANAEFTNVDGFVLLDHTHHYQIIFPKGW